jgi:hypothetical protein
VGIGEKVAAMIPGLDVVTVVTADSPADKTAEHTRIMADYVFLAPY